MKYAKRRTAKALALSAFLIGLASPAAAVDTNDTKTIIGDGKDLFSVHYLDKSENTGLFEPEKDEDTGKVQVPYTLSDYHKAGIASGLQYWADVLGKGANVKKPLDVYVHGIEQFANASASQHNYVNGEDKYTDAWIEAFQSGRVFSDVDPLSATEDKNEVVWLNGRRFDNYSFAKLTLGENFAAVREPGDRGWWTGELFTLPDGEEAADLDGTFRHELGHALGIIASRAGVFDSAGKVKKDREGLMQLRFAPEQTRADSYTLHLVDENLNPARPGMEIITPREFSRRNELAGGKLKQSDYFILSAVEAEDWKDGKRTGKAYFIGDHVTEALGGKTFDGVSGLRINGWENGRPELSHIQSKGMMAHDVYSNYTSFMEVELAVMQDIGYTLDRRKWFGRSIYTDGNTLTNTQGYFERNAAGTAYLDGTPSTAPLGIGLHIYGSNNTVTQAADLLADGAGAAGVRVDGENNRLTLDAGSTITAGGVNGAGVLFAYGKNHVFDQKGTVRADGENGTGVRFDFGSSSNGAYDEYRGSYIRYKREVAEGTGKVSGAENFSLKDTPELNGPLIKEYNLSGTVSGSDYAIYIGKNAFVKEINILPGAKIEGDIASDWKHFAGSAYDGPIRETKTSTEEDFSKLIAASAKDKETEEYVRTQLQDLIQTLDKIAREKAIDSKLQIQYNGKKYPYEAPIDDLFTNLNFKGDVSYAGNILGATNMFMNVKSGTLTFTGLADVSAVTVDKGATLIGGTYDIFDQKTTDADGTTLGSKTGLFTNHGTLRPDDKDMEIYGGLGEPQFVSDGTFGIELADRSTALKIAVSGMSALIDGSSVAPLDGRAYKRGAKYTFLTGDKGISGAFAQKAGDSFTDFLSISELDHDDASAWLVLGLDESAAETDAEKGVLGTIASSDSEYSDFLLSLSGGTGKKAIAGIAENPAADAAVLTMRSDRIGKAVRARSGWLNDLEPIEPRKAHYWYKADKDWSRYDSGAVKGNGYGFTLGADWQTGRNWTVGVLGQYGHDSWSLGGASWNSHKVKDWRFGVFAVNRAGQNELTTHLAIGRQTHENEKTVAYGTQGGQQTQSRYHSNTQELGLRFSRDLTPNGTWHHKPFASVQLTRYQQNAFDESGDGIRLHSDSFTKLYSAGTVGWTMERAMKDGSFGFSLGYKRVFSGDDPSVWTRVSGRAGGWKSSARKFDRNLFVAAAQGEWVLGKSWTANFGLELEQGRHDRNMSAKAAFCLSW